MLFAKELMYLIYFNFGSSSTLINSSVVDLSPDILDLSYAYKFYHFQ